MVKAFVTAKLQNQDDCRQGVVITRWEAIKRNLFNLFATPSTIFVLGESYKVYRCDRITVVPNKNLWGTAREFAIQQGVIK